MKRCRCDDGPSPTFLLPACALFPLQAVFFVILVYFYIYEVAPLKTLGGISFVFPSTPAHTAVLSNADGPIGQNILVIHIHEDGRVSVDGVLAQEAGNSSLRELRQHLRRRRDEVNRRGGLVVHVHGQVRFQRLIDVLSAVTASGIEHYGLSGHAMIPPPSESITREK